MRWMILLRFGCQFIVFSHALHFFFSSFFFTSVYLLFDPDSEIDILNKHVFNTEAHPFKIFNN